MSLCPTVDFLLHDWLKVESLQSRERFADHSRETFDAVLDTCERIAREKYAPELTKARDTLAKVQQQAAAAPKVDHAAEVADEETLSAADNIFRAAGRPDLCRGGK